MKAQGPAAGRPSAAFIPRCTIAAFGTTPETLEVLTAMSTDPLLSRARFTVAPGALETAVDAFPVGRTPDILLIEFSGDPDELDQLADVCSENTRVILIGAENDVAYYRKLMAKGVADYIFPPITDHVLIAALLRVFSGDRPARTGRVIACLGAGGGCGTSTVAQAMAMLSASTEGTRALLLDLDVYFGTSTLNFDIKPLKGVRDLMLLTSVPGASDIEQMMLEPRKNLFLLASPPSLEPVRNFDAEQISALIDNARQAVDHVVVDLPSGWSPTHEVVLAHADAICIVVTATLQGYRNLSALRHYLKQDETRLTTPQVVLNRHVRNAPGQVSLETFEKLCGTQNLTVLPDQAELFERAFADSAMPLDLPKSQGMKAALEPLHRRLVGEIARPTTRAGTGAATGPEAKPGGLRRFWPWHG